MRHAGDAEELSAEPGKALATLLSGSGCGMIGADTPQGLAFRSPMDHNI